MSSKKPPRKIIRDKNGRYKEFLEPVCTWDEFSRDVERKEREALGDVNLYYFSLHNPEETPTRDLVISYYEAHLRTG